MKIFIYLGLATMLSGCGGNVKEFPCTGQNWAAFGYKMGAEGRSVHEFDAHRKYCGANLENGAVKAYLDGYTLGIMKYCTYDNGYTTGAKNEPLNEHCPAEVRASFVQGYNVGRMELAQQMRQLTRGGEKVEDAQIKSSNNASNNAGGQ